MKKNDAELEDIEIRLLLEGLYLRFGYDFRDYSPASLKRRIRNYLCDEQVGTISSLQERVLHDPACLERFVTYLSINVTSMFRDPGFYLSFRKKVAPFLKELSFVRIWHMGCSSGEEVYSMAILLQEEGLYNRTRIYATDINNNMLEQAKKGIFPLSSMKEYTENYIKAGGCRSFSKYYTARYESALINGNLKKNILWAQHNLVTDSSFNEFHVILCRNVMIYFNRTLADRVHKLIYESLAQGGILGLGARESLKFSPFERSYEELDGDTRLFRKTG